MDFFLICSCECSLVLFCTYLLIFQIYDDDEQTFIVEVFSGCIRYAEIMNVVLRGFYAQDGKTTLRSEQSLYTGIFL